MNFKFVFKLVGRIVMLMAIPMALSMVVSLYYGEDCLPFLRSILILLAVGGLLTAIPASRRFYVREGFFSVGLIWLVMCLAGALPFWFSGAFASIIDCIFESVSGFTTTGATILTDIEELPNGLLFWRSFTHWLGGMGVLVLATAIVPAMGIRSHYLTQAETPGPVVSKLVPKQAQSSKILYGMYCVLTVVQVICLRLAGMPLFDSLIHAFGTAGTGGFSNRAASIGAYNNAAVEWIIAIFILLFSLNFVIYFLILTRRFRQAFASDEARFFLEIVALATGAILLILMLRGGYTNVWTALRHSFFTVSSIISTTGYAVADYAIWPQTTQIILVFIMICGGCAGSTSGGLKASRILLTLRCIKREIYHAIHPRSVQVVKLDGKVVDERTLHSTLAYICCFFLLSLLATMVVAIDEFSFATSFSAVITCTANAGPGLEMVGPTGNFSAFSMLSKTLLSFCMVIGRLEILPVLILFSPSTWKKV